MMSYRRKKRLTWVGVTNEGNRMSGAGPSKNGSFLAGREQELEIVKGFGPLDGNPSAVDCKEHSSGLKLMPRVNFKSSSVSIPT